MMQEEQIRVQVSIFGEQYSIRGKDSADHVRTVAQYVDQKMKNLASRNPRLSVAQLAVLTAINIADELKKTRDDYDSLVRMFEEDQG